MFILAMSLISKEFAQDSILGKDSNSAVQECLANIVENLQHTISVVSLIKDGPKSASVVPSAGSSKICSHSVFPDF
jgi:hypothetical protein